MFNLRKVYNPSLPFIHADKSAKVLLTTICFGLTGFTQELLLEDCLTTKQSNAGIKAKKMDGGRFTEKGWISEDPRGYLRIELTEALPFEGMLEIELDAFHWAEASASSGKDRKIHFINLFSNRLGDHHFEDGGTAEDAIITLRMGSDEEGLPRYGDTFKVLWASKGAKRAGGSDYHERQARLNEPYEWSTNPVFKVFWSRKNQTIRVLVDDKEFIELPWKNQVEPFRYIFLARAGDFYSLQGVYFKNLKIFSLE